MDPLVSPALLPSNFYYAYKYFEWRDHLEQHLMKANKSNYETSPNHLVHGWDTVDGSSAPPTIILNVLENQTRSTKLSGIASTSPPQNTPLMPVPMHYSVSNPSSDMGLLADGGATHRSPTMTINNTMDSSSCLPTGETIISPSTRNESLDSTHQNEPIPLEFSSPAPDRSTHTEDHTGSPISNSEPRMWPHGDTWWTKLETCDESRPADLSKSGQCAESSELLSGETHSDGEMNMSSESMKRKPREDIKIQPYALRGSVEVFKCPLCSKSEIFSRGQLTNHLQEHQSSFKREDYKHVCCFCFSELSSNSSLERHLLTHTNHRPFNCTFCDKAFTTNGNLSRHIRTSHQVKSVNLINPLDSNISNQTNWHPATTNDEQQLVDYAQKESAIFHSEQGFKNSTFDDSTESGANSNIAQNLALNLNISAATQSKDTRITSDQTTLCNLFPNEKFGSVGKVTQEMDPVTAEIGFTRPVGPISHKTITDGRVCSSPTIAILDDEQTKVGISTTSHERSLVSSEKNWPPENLLHWASIRLQNTALLQLISGHASHSHTSPSEQLSASPSIPFPVVAADVAALPLNTGLLTALWPQMVNAIPFSGTAVTSGTSVVLTPNHILSVTPTPMSTADERPVPRLLPPIYGRPWTGLWIPKDPGSLELTVNRVAHSLSRKVQKIHVQHRGQGTRMSNRFVKRLKRQSGPPIALLVKSEDIHPTGVNHILSPEPLNNPKDVEILDLSIPKRKRSNLPNCRQTSDQSVASDTISAIPLTPIMNQNDNAPHQNESFECKANKSLLGLTNDKCPKDTVYVASPVRAESGIVASFPSVKPMRPLSVDMLSFAVVAPSASPNADPILHSPVVTSPIPVSNATRALPIPLLPGLRFPYVHKKNSYKDAPKLITCPIPGCSQKFPWNSSLKRHILTHTPHKPFACTRCTKSFSTKSNRERHMERVHQVSLKRQRQRVQCAQGPDGQRIDSIGDTRSFNSACASETASNLPEGSEELREDEIISMSSNEKQAEDISNTLLTRAGDPVVEPNPERLYSAALLAATAAAAAAAAVNPGSNAAPPSHPYLSVPREYMLRHTQWSRGMRRNRRSQRTQVADLDWIKPEGDIVGSKSTEDSSEKAIDLSLQSTTSNNVTILRCSICLATVTTKSFRRHLTHHQMENVIFRCHLCQMSFNDRVVTLKHWSVRHSEEWTKFLGKLGSSGCPIDSLTSLIENVPYPKDEMETTINGDNAKSGVTDIRHVSCCICLHRFGSQQDLQRHMRSHTGERPFVCPDCGKEFSLKHSMHRHYRVHLKQGTIGSTVSPNYPSNVISEFHTLR
ncbi:unnamed protein product [Echinostoma caproni]|uniref:Ras-responsive element-binding protein 1 n=1 Tax=Echinostoma caproni TaxID=27848 RepID=A0A183AB03_9TREM|nr:unnamed protein product [Echinostoma caproni]